MRVTPWRMIEKVRAAVVYLAFALFFGFSAATRLEQYPVDRPAFIAIYGSLLLLVAMWLLPAFPYLRDEVRRRSGGLRGATTGLLLCLTPYLIYSLGTGDFL